MCVTCKVPLNIAEGAQPDSERDLIREPHRAGRDEGADQAARSSPSTGRTSSRCPTSDGVGLTAYAIPLALAGSSSPALALLVPRWRRRAGDRHGRADGRDRRRPDRRRASSATSTHARLDADLARYDATSARPARLHLAPAR